MKGGRDARAARRAAQFAKFRITELNLVQLVDTFVSIVFFALTSATVGELAPVAAGVRLPEASIGGSALQQLTLGVGRDITLGGNRVIGTIEAVQTIARNWNLASSGCALIRSSVANICSVSTPLRTVFVTALISRPPGSL